MAGEDLSADLTLHGGGLTVGDLMAHWPRQAAPGARIWMLENMEAANVTDFDAIVRLGGEAEEVKFDFSFTDAVGHYLRPMPPITAGVGAGQVDLKRFSLSVDSAIVTPDGGAPLLPFSVERLWWSGRGIRPIVAHRRITSGAGETQRAQIDLSGEDEGLIASIRGLSIRRAPVGWGGSSWPAWPPTRTWRRSFSPSSARARKGAQSSRSASTSTGWVSPIEGAGAASISSTGSGFGAAASITSTTMTVVLS